MSTPEEDLCRIAMCGTEMSAVSVTMIAQGCDATCIASCTLAASFHSLHEVTATLLAVLWEAEFPEFESVFTIVACDEVIRRFVHNVRKGLVTRQSFGSQGRRLIQNWLERQKIQDLLSAPWEYDVNIIDLIRLVHPKPSSPVRSAAYAYICGHRLTPEQTALLKQYDLRLHHRVPVLRRTIRCETPNCGWIEAVRRLLDKEAKTA